eukprot:XP_001707756.1 Hypothetical protein GL50803_38500 [Giardia lamblia ATCC 50803]
MRSRRCLVLRSGTDNPIEVTIPKNVQRALHIGGFMRRQPSHVQSPLRVLLKGNSRKVFETWVVLTWNA